MTTGWEIGPLCFHIWVYLLLFCANIPFWSIFSLVYLYFPMFIFISLYLPSFSLIYPYLVIFTLNCHNLTIYAIFTIHRYSSSATAPLYKVFKAVRQIIKEILHLKLCDLNLTFRGPKSSKILRKTERLYTTSYYVFLINFRHSMLRLWITDN